MHCSYIHYSKSSDDSITIVVVFLRRLKIFKILPIQAKLDIISNSVLRRHSRFMAHAVLIMVTNGYDFLIYLFQHIHPVPKFFYTLFTL